MLKKSLYTIIMLSLFAVSVSETILAQTTVNYTGYLVKDDNAFKNREAYDEWINTSALLLGHQFIGDH